MRRRRAATLTAFALVALFAAGAVAPAASAGVAKGIAVVPSQSEMLDPVFVRSLTREIGGSLGSDWVRPAGDLGRSGARTGRLLGAGVRLPRRARRLVPGRRSARACSPSRPPRPGPRTAPGGRARRAATRRGHQPFYPASAQALPAFSDFAEHLARRYAGKVRAVEVWNEPNLWMFLYPQRTASDPLYGVHAYLRMLKAFHKGVARVHTGMRVVAGTTGPVGLNDVYRTSPQRFARALKSAGAARYFDAYSHHPYTPGGTIYQAPDQPPNDPGTTVTLYNLRTLLRLFPSKPFYLSEYAYSTRPNLLFGISVSEARQARYLKDAYAVAGRYPQVKMLAWYLLRDQRPSAAAAETGVYTGLRRLDGSKKPAWYAFRHRGQ